MASAALQSPFPDLSDDFDSYKLSLKHHQQLEFAKEYDSIIAEPLGSRLKTRSKSARAAAHDLSARPAWTQAVKCRMHPWRPLQWDHVSQNQLAAFETGLRDYAGHRISGVKPAQPADAAAGPTATPSAQGRASASADAAGALHQYQVKGQGDRRHALAAGHAQSLAGASQHHTPSSTGQPLSLEQPAGGLKGSYAAQAHCRQPVVNAGAAVPSQSRQSRPSTAAAASRVLSAMQQSRPGTRQTAAGTKGQRGPSQAQRGSSSHACASSSVQQQSRSPAVGTVPTAGAARFAGARHCRGGAVDAQGSDVAMLQGAQPVQPGRAGGSRLQSPCDAGGLGRGPPLLGNWIRWEASASPQKAASGPSASSKRTRPEGSPGQLVQSYQQAAHPGSSSADAVQPQGAPSPARRHVLPCSSRQPQSAAQQAAGCAPAADAGVPRPHAFRQVRMPSPARDQPTAQPRSPATQPRQPVQQCQMPGGQLKGSEDWRRAQQAAADISRSSGADAAGGGMPRMRYCLSSGQPAHGAGIWEEQTTRSWLRDAGLAILPADEAAPLLENPLRNGSLLCDLAGALEGRIVWGTNRQPKSLASARSNIMAALGHMGMLTAQTCPRGLVLEVEHILQGRQASIWGLLNHLRLTHPSAAALSNQCPPQQPVDRTLGSTAEMCRPDRCSGPVAAATEGQGDGTAVLAHAIDVTPHGSVRCTSPVAAARSPRQQQVRKRQVPSAPCPYHDRETITVSLVSESGLYTPPERSLSPQCSRGGSSPPRQQQQQPEEGGMGERYVRLVAVGPAVATAKQDSGCCSSRQHSAKPQRCPEPAAAAPGGSRRKQALVRLRSARQQVQRQQLTAADVQQRVAAKMCDRKKQGAAGQWSSRKGEKESLGRLSDIELVGWMRSKGLSEVSPGMFLEGSFADGRLLCRLVGLLERTPLSSVEWCAPSIAAARHNIAKALAQLKKKPSMSLQNLWQVEDVVQAQPSFIQCLLTDIVNAYS